MDAICSSNEHAQRDALIEQYQGYVHATVRKLIKFMGLPANRFDDFVSAGYLGLVEAAGRFDAQANDNFQNYAYLRIRGAIIDSIREGSELKGVGYKRAQALAAAHDVRMEEFNRSSITKTKSKDSNELEQTLNLAAKTALTHRLSFHDAEEAIQQSEGFADTPEQELITKQNKERIHTLIATLPEKERLVIENFYFKDMSFTDIAQKHAGLSKSWVSRIHDKGLDQLKSWLLRPYRPTLPANSEPIEVVKQARRGRPPSAERRLSRANSNKPSGKRGKSRPRTLRGGRLLSRQDAPTGR